MKVGKKNFVLAAVILCLFEIGFADLELHGFLRNHNAFRLVDPNDAMLLRNRMRLNTELWGDNIYGFASLDFLNDVVTDSHTSLNLREAYLDIYSKWVDFRIGKQQVVWGKADGYFINDIVNPLDLSLFLLQDFEDIRMATTMLNTKLHTGNHSLEILVIPEFKPMNIDWKGNWAFYRPDSFNFAMDLGGGQLMAMTLPLDYREEVIPRNGLKNMEYGLKLNAFLKGTDISLIYLKAREDQPKMKKTVVPGNIGIPSAIQLTPIHPWFTFYGMNFSRPLGMFVFRGEGGYYPSRLFDYVPADQAEMMTSDFLLDRPFIQAMLGADYQLTGDITIAIQGIQERILNYSNTILRDEVASLGSLVLNGSFFNQTVAPMLLTLYNFTNESYLIRLSADWKYSDNFTVSLGADFLGGGSMANSYGQFDFGQFDKNDNIYLKLRYNF
ncbi:MAG: hypothetical protein JXR87_08740 [Candidatus Marinimicrobia bacterium]|nr:hypothetical protein [Candidatus Neomarinimicrobiota bacterium]